jgi:hypothetical protein
MLCSRRAPSSGHTQYITYVAPSRLWWYSLRFMFVVVAEVSSAVERGISVHAYIFLYRFKDFCSPCRNILCYVQ